MRLRELAAAQRRRLRAAEEIPGRAAERLAATLGRIHAHDPSARGFAVVQVGTRVLRRARDLRPGESASIVFCDGRAEATINSIHIEEESDA
jgi:exonuclease VII large subunit